MVILAIIIAGNKLREPGAVVEEGKVFFLLFSVCQGVVIIEIYYMP